MNLYQLRNNCISPVEKIQLVYNNKKEEIFFSSRYFIFCLCTIYVVIRFLFNYLLPFSVLTT